jgi:hypothetical protein
MNGFEAALSSVELLSDASVELLSIVSVVSD